MDQDTKAYYAMRTLHRAMGLLEEATEDAPVEERRALATEVGHLMTIYQSIRRTVARAHPCPVCHGLGAYDCCDGFGIDRAWIGKPFR